MTQICQHFNVWCERSVGVCKVEFCWLSQAGEPFGDDIQFVHLASMSMLVEKDTSPKTLCQSRGDELLENWAQTRKYLSLDPLGYVNSSKRTWRIKWVLAPRLGSRVIPTTKSEVFCGVRDKTVGREKWQDADVGAVLSWSHSVQEPSLVFRDILKEDKMGSKSNTLKLS